MGLHKDKKISNSIFALYVYDDDDDDNHQTHFFFSYPFLISAVSNSNNVTHSKETYIIVKMTMFCDEDKTNTFQFPMNK